MTPADFLATRQRLGMSRAAFCRALGLSQNAGTKYEHGRTRIPRYVALACSALLYGLPPVGEHERNMDSRSAQNVVGSVIPPDGEPQVPEK